jgi:hypothetical protein
MAAVGYIYKAARCQIPQAQASYSPPWKHLNFYWLFWAVYYDHMMQKTCQKSTRYTHFCIFHGLYGLYLLHFLNYSCFLLIIIIVGIVGNTDFNHSSQKLIHSIPFFNAISHETGLYKISGCCKFFLHHKTTVGVDISEVLRKHT